MAIFEKEKSESKEYLAMLDANGDMVAFVSPIKGVSNQLIQDALAARGVNVEIRTPKADVVSIEL